MADVTDIVALMEKAACVLAAKGADLLADRLQAAAASLSMNAVEANEVVTALQRDIDDFGRAEIRQAELDAITRHGAGDAEAWRSIESAPSEGVIELAVASKTGADRRTMVAERSFRDGEPYWIVTHGWVGWTTLHPEWAPYAWRPLPAPPTDDAARAGERGVS